MILVLFTVPFYHFLFFRYLVLVEHHFSSDILAPFPDSRYLYSHASRAKTLPTADALLKPHVETNVKEMLTMKHQQSPKYYNKTVHELPTLREGDVVRVKPNLGEKT